MGLGRTTTSTERHLHLIGLKLKHVRVEGPRALVSEAIRALRADATTNAICNADCNGAGVRMSIRERRRRKWVCTPEAQP